MKRFISSVVFALTILTAAASFAQSPSPAESNEATPASTASDTVDVQHVIDACHEAGFTPRILQEADREPAVISFVADWGSPCFQNKSKGSLTKA